MHTGLFKKDSFSKRLQKIKNNDNIEREKLIEEYIPFIIKTITTITNRYIECENSDEYSIGLEAFNEAIDKYDISKGSFVAFAQLVIQSRITDLLRKNKKYNKVTQLSQLSDDDQTNIQYKSISNSFEDNIDMKEEIIEFKEKLSEYNITFSDLIKESPKHDDTRINAIKISNSIVNSQDIIDEIINKKKFPIVKISRELQVSPKVLKRSKKFIIATVLILSCDFQLIKNYPMRILGGDRNDL
ncbi:RNA polymerase sigma-I factor [Alkalithermobacter paradoxus]|uniref:RNA polymerase sigma factor SigI n=1 Tax=Alkalithermobacter paradoxus TaxID=29349 RepID=A0A1V4I9A7_9FIRM|nr:RNA polymerase sigma factor SigI [[Clostridium] thermoalcaliphilum]